MVKSRPRTFDRSTFEFESNTDGIALEFVDHHFSRASPCLPVDLLHRVSWDVLAQVVEIRSFTWITNVDRTGEDLWNATLDECVLDILHLWEDEEIIVQVNLTLVVE